MAGPVRVTGATDRVNVTAMFSLFCAFSILPAFSASSGGWQFSWSEEFNGPAIDGSVWGYENGYVRNSELQYYTNRPENARIDNGTLLIQALRDNWNGHEYTSASLRTMGKKSWLYGRFEMRAKIDVRAGSWPAWWWLPNSGGWPRGGEIDMMEYYRNRCLFNVMDGNRQWTSITRSISSLGGDWWVQNYHIWTWEWDSTTIDLYLDGVLMNHYPVANADGTGPNGANPFRRPGYILVNQAIGGTNGGDPSGTAFPVDYRVDWIRVHTWSEQAAYALTVTSGTGSGPYVAGTAASITAKMPPVGQTFERWVAASGNPTIDNAASPTALLTMPAADVTVTATYRTGSGVRPLQEYRYAVPRSVTRDYWLMYDIHGRKITSISNQTGYPATGIFILTQKNHLSCKRIMKLR
ncbi:MAG: glycoside hydrolase family 16 protein [Chitinispirillaceae bacterium]|nr:glycoside hydrolase family 16 protein [Chitinispirillaceae bacterium]